MLMVLLALLCTMGCTPKKRFSGSILNPDDFAKITVNKSSMQDVVSTLGSPSFQSLHNPSAFYYSLSETLVKPTRAVTPYRFTTYQFSFTKDRILRSIQKVTTTKAIQRHRQSTPVVYKRPPLLEEILATSANRFQ